MQENTSIDNFEDTHEDFNLKGFVFSYLRYWYIYIIAIIISLGCAYLYNWYVKPIYNVTTKILIKDDNNSSVGTQELLKELDVYSVNKNIENEIEILKSRNILKKTLQQIEVDVLYYLIGNVKKSQLYTD